MGDRSQYSTTGGQESDKGTIHGFTVQKAEKKDTEIAYTLKRNNIGKGKERIEIYLKA